jgi:hypothetical protein
MILRCFVCVATLSALALLATPPPQARAASPPPGPTPVTGCLNQTLTDGFWNLKVTSVTLGTIPGTDIVAWGVAFTFGAARSEAKTPSTLGVGQPQLVLKDGTKLDMSTSSEIAFSHAIIGNTFKPGNDTSGTYWYASSDLTAKATTFFFPVNPNNSVYNTPLGYPVKNPAFRVDLTCNKAPK